MNKDIKELTDFFNNIKGDEGDLATAKSIRDRLSPEGIQCLDAVEQLIKRIANWSAETMLLHIGAVAEADHPVADGHLAKLIKRTLMFSINPLLLVKLLHEMNIKIDRAELIQSLLKSFANLTKQDLDGIDNDDDFDSDAALKEFEEEMKKFKN